MSPRFSTSKKGSTKTTNYEGAPAFSMSPKFELYSLACTSVLHNKFYETAEDELKRARKLIKKVPSDFVAKLAIYCREKMYLRTIPVVLTVELAMKEGRDKLPVACMKRVVTRVIQRADEIPEMLAYYSMLISPKEDGVKKLYKIPKALKEGIADAFGKFDEYQFGKYDRKQAVTIRDAMFLCHPKPPKEKEGLYKKIADQTLEVPYTWEVEFSKLGQQKFENDIDKALAFREKWEEFIDSGRLGYMAMLRNLRNMIQSAISKEHFIKVCDFLSDPERVHKSRQFPFRYFSAYKELQGLGSFETKRIQIALEKAVKSSIDNYPGMNDDIVIACDVSRSMETSISQRSSVQRFDIGLLLGQLLALKAPSNIVGIFGNIWKEKSFTSDSPLQNTMRLHEIEGEVGYSTNGWTVIKWLIKKKIKADKVMIFTDCEMWDSTTDYYAQSNVFGKYWTEYKQFCPKAELWLFDLAGYETTPVSINQGNVYMIAGWSDKIFEAIESMKKGDSAIKMIEDIEIY